MKSFKLNKVYVGTWSVGRSWNRVIFMSLDGTLGNCSFFDIEGTYFSNKACCSDKSNRRKIAFGLTLVDPTPIEETCLRLRTEFGEDFMKDEIRYIIEQELKTKKHKH